MTIRFAGLRLAAVVLTSAAVLFGCSVLEKDEDPTNKLAAQSFQKPLPPEKTGELVSKVGSNWLYGQGVGETALTVGSIFAFPPYAIYVLGNGALSLAGYKALYVTDALPDSARDGWNSMYDRVTGAPGQVAAAVAGKEYRTQDVIREDMNEFVANAYDGQQKEPAKP